MYCPHNASLILRMIVYGRVSANGDFDIYMRVQNLKFKGQTYMWSDLQVDENT